MSRPLRVEFPGAIYHVMARGVAKMPIFYDDDDRRFLLFLIEEMVKAGRLVVDAFCFLLNHFHLLGETPQGGLGRCMQIILSRYAGRFNRRHERAGHLLQGRYKAILVDDGEYFQTCSRYIHRNPCKFVERIEDHPWSSYPSYIGGVPVVDWVQTSRTLECWDNPAQYRSYVETAAEPANPFGHAVAGLVYGGDRFVREIRRRVQRQATGSEQDVLGLRTLRRWGETPPVEAVRRLVEMAFRDYTATQRRRTFAYLLRECSHLPNREVAHTIGKTPGAVSHILRSLNRRRREDQDFADRIAHLLHQLIAAPVGASEQTLRTDAPLEYEVTA